MSDEARAAGERPADQHVPWWLLTGAGVLTQILSMLGGVMAARMLGVEGRGQLLLVATLGGLASQLTLGGALPDAITKRLADRGVTARDGLRGMVRRWLPMALGAAVLAAGYFLFLEWDTRDTDVYLLTLGVVLTALLSMASRVLMGAMLGEASSPVHIALTGVLPQAAVVIVIGAALALGADWNAVQVTAVTVGCTGLVLLARLRVLRPATGNPADRLDGDELARLSRRTHIGSVGPLDGLAIDRLMVGSLLGNHLLGLYSVAYALTAFNNILGLTLGRLAIPRVALLQKDPAAEARYVRSALLLAVALLGSVVVVLVLIMEPFIRLTFGPDFLDAAECARWVVLASFFLGFRRVLIGILQGRDRARFASLTELVLTPLMVAGILGAVLADSLVLVGVTMTVVGAAACLVLGVAVARSAPRMSVPEALP